MEPQYIRQLAIEEISGIISFEDRVALYNAIIADKNLYIIWRDEHKKFESDEIKEWLSKPIIPPFKIKNYSYVLAKFILIVAGIGAIAFLIAYFFLI